MEYGKDLKQKRRDHAVTEGGQQLLASPLLNVLDTLPNGGDLVPLFSMPFLDWAGTVTDFGDVDEAARQYTVQWRREVGGCNERDVERARPHPTTRDLFCKERREGNML